LELFGHLAFKKREKKKYQDSFSIMMLPLVILIKIDWTDAK